jgi:hypothetical protein
MFETKQNKGLADYVLRNLEPSETKSIAVGI